MSAHLPHVLVAGHLLWIDDAEHLAEALANAGDPLRWIAEGQFAPRHIVDLSALQIN